MAELFLEMTQWKKFMSASAWVQVLDFTKSLVYSNCQNDRKCLLFFFFFFLFFFFFFFVLFLFVFVFCCFFFFVYVPCMRFITYMFVSFRADLMFFICKKGSFGNTASKA